MANQNIITGTIVTILVLSGFIIGLSIGRYSATETMQKKAIAYECARYRREDLGFVWCSPSGICIDESAPEQTEQKGTN